MALAGKLPVLPACGRGNAVAHLSLAVTFPHLCPLAGCHSEKKRRKCSKCSSKCCYSDSENMWCEWSAKGAAAASGH